ncbi:MAG: PPC domain-containing protein [Deltaproteobacteria bacterium]|nr:PPC domain-containing protein [Deltaproteobacteria bacterium]
MRAWRTLLAVGATCACTAAPSSTQGRFTAVHNAFGALGMNVVGHISEGSLGEDGSSRFPVTLEAQCYTWAAFGGDGARDLDLSLLDTSNNRVATDTSHDTQATLRHCVTSPGRYTLVLHMAQGAGTYLVSSWRGGPAGGESSGASDVGTCANPIPLTMGQTVTGDTRRARDRATGGCLGGGEGDEGGGDGAPDLVYQLTVESRQQVTVAVEQDEDYDGAVFLRQACDDPSSEVACNDDAGDTSHSRVSATLEPGTYFVYVDGFGSSSGRFSMTVTGQAVPTPAEVCQDVQVLTPNQPVSGQTSAGDPSVFNARCADRAPGPEHVYRLEVPNESRLQLQQESPNHDGVLYVRRACADEGSELSCNDDSDDTQHSRINTILPAGTYYVFSDAYRQDGGGSFSLEADLCPVAGGNTPGDTAQDAQPLTVGQAVEGNTFQAHDDITVPCAAQTDGYDVLYRLDVTQRSRARLWFEQNDIAEQGVVALVRNPAQAATTTVACRANVLGEARALDQVLDPGTWYVVVDSAGPRQFGRYRLHAEVEDVQILDRLCRAAPLLVPGRPAHGTTSGSDHFQATCGGNARSPENLHRLRITRRSNVRLAVTSNTPGYDPVLYLRQTCTDIATERGCNDDAGDIQHSLVEVTLEPGVYTVFVDGFSNRNSGAYTLEATLSPATP